jgi:CubicO group peptidase (beta-lactamase class C family)
MRLISVLLLALLLFQTMPVAAPAQPLNPDQREMAAFAEFVKTQMAADKVPGLSIAYQKGDVIWAQGFGFADLENQLPAKPESMYRLASVTKPMTATAILQLAEKGKIDLDAEVQTYVPYFPKKNFPVTVRQLLGHLGGISHYKDYDKEGHFKDRKTTRESIAVFENFDLIAEPGTRYSYSSYGYNLLGAVIEGASGQSYGDYMRENVWKPLGMSDTRMDSPVDIIPNRVRGYEIVNGQIKNSEFVDVSSRFSAGGTRSTVLDLLKFAKGINEGKILSRASLDLMQNSMATKKGELTNYSAGWGTFPVNGRYGLSHSGGQQETSTYLLNFPSRKLAIAIAINEEGADTFSYVSRLFELLTGEAWNVNSYIAGERNKVPLIVAMQGVFEEGRAHFEKTGKAYTDNPQETAAAFALFNQTLSEAAFQTAAQQDVFRKISQARQMRGGPMVRIGSYMAQKLQEKYGAARLNSYSNTGAIGFFNDYIELAGAAPEFRFNDEVAKTVAAWNESWARTNTAAMRRLTIGSGSNFDELGAQLQKDFANQAVYPNFSGNMISVIRQLVQQGQAEKALKVSDLAVKLYPGLDQTNAYSGVMNVLAGGREKGKQLLKTAAAINGGGLASAGGLNGLAYEMANAGMADGGLALLQVAIELYPNAANLYDTIGEFYLKKGMKDKAVEFYQKAVTMDAKYPNAEKAKEILQQLTAKP